MSRCVAVIPARYASTRFPGKPLALIAGKPMIQHVCEQAARSTVDHVIVATDDDRIRDCVQAFGGTVAMTRTDHETGTDRIAEAIKDINADLIINIQGDEPLLPPSVLDQLIDHMRAHPSAAMGTIARPISPDQPEFQDPNVVKVIRDLDNYAIYFSRAPIPYSRGDRDDHAQPLHHWGVYAYRRDFLTQFVSWPPGSLEQCEKLEQLRALEHGAKIYVMTSTHQSIGVDVPEDIARVEAILAKQEKP